MNPYRTLWPQMMALTLAAFARNVIVSAAIVLTALAGADNAHAAACSAVGVPNPLNLAFNQVNIPPNAQVGDVLASVTADFPVNCPANQGTLGQGFYLQFFMNVNYKLSATVSGAWELPSPIKGLGVRVTNITHGMVLGGAACTEAVITLNTNCLFAPAGLTTIPVTFTLPIRFKVELVKTGDPISGTPTSMIVGFRSYDLATTGTAMSNKYGNLYFGTTTPVASTCTVKTPNIAVTLPTLNVADLSPVGKTGGDTNFQIDLSCSGGKSVYLTLSDATNPGNTTNELTLTSGSSASGVKLQILRSGNTLVNFGPDTAVSGNPGQWLVGSSGASGSSGNNLSIPLTARYYSTGPVTPGTVNAVATFILYYQ